MADRKTGLPSPADFAAPPTAADHARWAESDRAARPARLARVRARFAQHGVEAYFGVRRENTRYLTGFVLGEGEEKVAGHSGQFLVGGSDVVVLADSRYTIQAGQEATGARIEDAGYDLPEKWRSLVASVGAKRVAVEAGFVSHALWRRLEEAAPDVELVPVEGWIEADREIKEPAEVERIAAACAVADRALASLLPKIQAGRHGSRARAGARVAAPDRRRGGRRLRPDLPRRPQGSPAARIAGRGAGHERIGRALRFRGAGGGLPERHDADAVRRRAVGAGRRGVQARGRGAGRRDRAARGDPRRRSGSAVRARPGRPR